MSTHQKYSVSSCLWQQKVSILLKLHPTAMSSACQSGFLSVKVSGEEEMDILKDNRIGLCEQFFFLKDLLPQTGVSVLWLIGYTWENVKNKPWSQHHTSVTCFRNRKSILEVPKSYVHNHLVLVNSLQRDQCFITEWTMQALQSLPSDTCASGWETLSCLGFFLPCIFPIAWAIHLYSCWLGLFLEHVLS